MRFQSILLASTIIAASSVAAAPAAAQAVEEKAPFSGLYLGASVGYDAQPNDVGEAIKFDRNLDGRFGDTVTTSAGANAFSPGFCNGLARTNAPTSGCINDRDGLSYSGRVGYDRQFRHIVVGVVGEFGTSDIRDSVSAYSTTPASYSLTREIDYTANLRARAGVALNHSLFYATGGGLYAKVKNSFQTTNTANAFAGRGKNDAWGFTVGGGMEQKISKHVSIGVEYLFNNVKDADYRVRATAGTAPATNPFILAPNTTGTDFARSYEKFRWHSVRAVALFRF